MNIFKKRKAKRMITVVVKKPFSVTEIFKPVKSQ